MLKIVIKVNSYFFCSVVHLDNLNLKDLTGENFTRPVKFTATFRTDKNLEMYYTTELGSSYGACR